ncbi:MAG TPA: gluconate transporter [Verrucomicrobiales bacterium]|nr:gluconate transporter [Verrucomicrobiales bacterium]HBE97288.1 gluconate transporter [Verrucomicrobiales bacterium]|tara:strand:- start:2796 stop:4235 length:1440 start_codon:yes stop_codon:yes gene_type:complete
MQISLNLGTLLATADVSTGRLIGTLLVAIALILFLILKWRVQAFIALLVASVFVGIAAGTMSMTEVGGTIVDGMGSSLGFIATIIGLGAIFGAMIEHSGGAQSLANGTLKFFGEKRATWAMLVTGFLISIPVFLDVALVILAPILYALSRKTGKSLTKFGMPLLAGMVVTHSFVPPTPGPTWVAYEFGVPIGTVILYSVLVGLPTAIIAGIWFGDRMASKVHIDPPELEVEEESNPPSFGMIAGILLLPIVLIVAGSLVEQSVGAGIAEGLSKSDRGAALKELMADAPIWQQIIAFLGHPVLSLLLATILTLWLLGVKRGATRDQLMEVSTRALGPAGIIILITGAGGVFKTMLGKTGVGDALANTLDGLGVGPLILAFLFSAISRIAQGSATMAMVMAASLMSPILAKMDLSDAKLSLIVVAIASGAAGFSHVNDSGFWMVSRYMRMTEKQTFQTWSAVSTAVGLVGVGLASLVWLFV